MIVLALTPLVLGAAQAATPTLAERCPNGFADPEIYQHLSREPDLDAYPTEALRRGMKGAVAVELVIGCDGVVKQCTIISSSGHRVLDEHACQVMAKVAFTPPRDENGNPREGLYRTRMSFHL